MRQSHLQVDYPLYTLRKMAQDIFVNVQTYPPTHPDAKYIEKDSLYKNNVLTSILCQLVLLQVPLYSLPIHGSHAVRLALFFCIHIHLSYSTKGSRREPLSTSIQLEQEAAHKAEGCGSRKAVLRLCHRCETHTP